MSKPRVLILDDEPLMAATVSDMAEACGWKTIVIHNPEQALTLLRNHVADVLLTDFKMPKYTGMEIIKALRHTDLKLPVILMSGFASSIDHDEARRLNVFTILEKPFGHELLSETLNRALALIRYNPGADRLP